MYFILLLPMLSQAQHFFGPPAVGFGVGLVSVYSQRFPLATSIVSRRSSRSYSHQTFWRPTTIAWGVVGGARYARRSHYQTASNLAYYQPNIYHYHSTPWRYRWGRSTDESAREKREARLIEIGGDLSTIPVARISEVAENVSIAYDPDVWQNDMIFKDQDDCSKRLLCELNARAAAGRSLSPNEELIAQAFGKNNNLDINKETLEFDIAAVLGRKVGALRCELSYRRCTVSVEEMMDMVETEVEEVEAIEKEVSKGVISVEDVQNRLQEEDLEVAGLSVADLTQTTTTTTTTTTSTTTTTTTTTTTPKGYYPGIVG